MDALDYQDVDANDAPPIEVQTSLTDVEKWVKKVHIQVAVEQVNKAFDAAVGELAGTVRLPGFRPGKVPRGYAEKLFGEDLKRHVCASLVARAFKSALKKENLEVVGSPEIDMSKISAVRGKELAFDVDVEVKPTFELGKYKGLAVEQEEVEIPPEEVEEHLDKMRLRMATEGDAPEGATMQERDAATGPLRYVLEGKEIHAEPEAQLLILEGHVVGVRAHVGSSFLEGAKAAEKRTIEVTLPDDSPAEEGRGKKVTLEFEIKKIQRPVLPDLDDAWAQKIGAKDLATLREKVTESMRNRLTEEVQAKLHQDLLGQVVGSTPFDVPKRLLGSYSARMDMEQRAMMERMGLDPEMFKGESLRGELAGDAEKRIREFLVLDALCKQEKIEASDEEVDEEVVRLAREQGVRAAELLQKLEEEGTLEQVKIGLKTKKAMEFLTENAEIKVIPRKKKEKAGCGHPEHHHH